MSAARSVRVIPQTINPTTRMPDATIAKRRVAGYARVSTDSDEQFTSGGHRKPHGQRAARHAHPQDTVQETGEEGHPQSRLHPRRRRELHAVKRIYSCGIPMVIERK